MISYYFNETIYLAILLVLSVYILLLFTFFLLLNTFDTRFIKNLSDLKKFGTVFPFNLFFLITILSFAGVPPLLGFSIKLIVFLLLINSSVLIYLIILTVFNFFSLYFYIQNIRYVVNNSSNNYYLYANNFVVLSDINMFITILIFLANMGGILYLSDILLFFNILLVC